MINNTSWIYVKSILIEILVKDRYTMEELLEYDIESILLSRVRDIFPYHQKIISACDSFFHVVSNSVKKERAQKHDYTEKVENNAAIIANISSQIKDMQNKSSALVLQQKVLEKQMSNTIKHQDKIRDEINAERSQEESYALEIVDLEQEVEEKKLKKKLKWNGIKRALMVYKSTLQIFIHIIESTEVSDKIRIIFFKLSKNEDPKFYVDLIRTSDSWRVESIHPSMEKHEEQLKCVVNFKKDQEISDITAFLCTLRKLFKENRKI